MSCQFHRFTFVDVETWNCESAGNLLHSVFRRSKQPHHPRRTLAAFVGWFGLAKQQNLGIPYSIFVQCHLDAAWTVRSCRMLRSSRMPCNPSLTVCRFCPNTNWHPPQGEIVLASYCWELEINYLLVWWSVTCHILQIPLLSIEVHPALPQENICHLGHLLLCRTLHHGLWHAFTDDNLGAALSTGGSRKRQQGMVKLKSKRLISTNG